MRGLIMNCFAVMALFAMLSAFAYNQREEQCKTRITTKIRPYQHLICIQ